MKIIIHSLDELLQLAKALSTGPAPLFTAEKAAAMQGLSAAESAGVRAAWRAESDTRAENAHGTVHISAETARAMGLVEPEGLPTDIEPPDGYTEPDDVRELRESLDALEDRDADGALYDTRWHSEPKKLTDKGVFRARRGRDNDAYKAWLLEQAVEVAEAAVAGDAEPVATETHALPQDKCWDEGCVHNEVPHQCVVPQEAPQAPASIVDLEALIAASQEAALDASDSHVDLLNACRDFTTKYGHPAFTALKAAVAPDGDSGQGKTVQHLTPGERRLMQACIANYPSKEA